MDLSESHTGPGPVADPQIATLPCVGTVDNSTRPVAALSVAAPGPAKTDARTGALGVKRSKAGASLRYAVADARHWAERFGIDNTQVLENPSVTQFWTTVATIKRRLEAEWNSAAAWGAEFAFFFSGHGTRRGEIVLRDGDVGITELVASLADAPPTAASARLKLGFALDCCYSGAALITTVMHLPSRVSLRDALASSLHDEESYEYDELGHGLFTYVMKHRAVDLAQHSDRIIDVLTRNGWTIEGDRLVPPITLPGTSPLLQPGLLLQERFRNTLVDLQALPYLSDGDQHALDVMNSHLITVRGRGDLDIAVDDVSSIDELAEQIEDMCRQRPLDLGVSFPGFPANFVNSLSRSERCRFNMATLDD